MSYSTDPSNVPLELFVGGYTTQTDNIETVLFDSNGPSLQGIVLLTPADGAINVSVTPSFTWDSETDYAAYKILIADNAEYTNAREAYVTAKNYNEVTALLNNTNYFWKVGGGDITDRPPIPIETNENDSREGDEISLQLIYEASKGDHIPTLASTDDLPDPTQTISSTNLRTPITQRSYIINGELYQLMYLQDPGDRVWRNFGEPWNNKTGWATSGMSLDDDIYGVTTEMIDGEKRVTGIDVRNNVLIGQLSEFPGLHKMRSFHVKQIDPQVHVDYMNNARQGRYLKYERLSGPLPNSLGHTSCTDISLSGTLRGLFDTENYLFSVDGGFNSKNSDCINKFTGGIPDSWGNLAIEYLELRGQNEYFNGVLKDSVVSNWRIKRISLYGPAFNDKEYGNRINYERFPADNNYVGSGFGGMIPSGVKNWVDCEGFGLSGQLWDGIALDAFEGWNDVQGRSVGISYDAPDYFVNDQNYFFQDLPDLSSLYSARTLSFGNRGWTGEYPYYVDDFPNLQEFRFKNHRFTGTQDVITNSSKSRDGRWYAINIPTRWDSLMQANMFQQDMYLGGLWENRVILYGTQGNTNLVGNMPEGAHEWYRGRYVQFNTGMTGNLPSKPPCLNSPSLRQLDLSCNFEGPIPEGYGEVGSTYAYGGSLISSGESITRSLTATNVGSDVTGFYVEDSNQSWGVDEFKPSTDTVNGPRVLRGSSTSRVISNTETRIYFENDLGFNIGDSFDVVKNQETDNRDFTDGLNLSGQRLNGAVPESLALKHAKNGAVLDIRNNLFTIADILPSYNVIKNMADANGWTYRYAPQKPFGQEQTIETLPYTINYSNSFITGNEYKWYKDGEVIQGENTEALEVLEDGEYYVEVTNPSLPDFSGSNVLKSNITIVNTTTTD